MPSCAEFQALSFDKKRYFNPRSNEGKIFKIQKWVLYGPPVNVQCTSER